MGEATHSIYRTIKFPLKKLFSPDHIAIFEGAVQNGQKVATRSLEFVKLFTLYQLSEGHAVPELDENFYNTVIRVVSRRESNRGREFRRNDELYEALLKFHQNHFLPLSPIYNARVPVNKLSVVLKYMGQSFKVTQQNNIVMNFHTYIRRYVNKFFLRQLYSENGWADDYKMTTAQKSTFYRQMKYVKDDILFCRRWNGGYQSDPLYHEWLDTTVNRLYPEPVEGVEIRECGLYYDVCVRPSAYLGFMIAMNVQFEEWGSRLYSPLCLRSSLSPKYIKIDTGGLIDLLATQDDLKALHIEMGMKKKPSKEALCGAWSHLIDGNISKEDSFFLNTRLWQHFTKFGTNKYTRHLLRRDPYVFDNSILTDGVGVSVLQVRKDRVGKTWQNNTKEFKCVFDDVPYLSKLSEEERAYLQENTVKLSCDPGKRNIIYITNENGNSLRYTSQQRAVECRFKKNKRAMVAMKQNVKGGNLCPNGQTVENMEQAIGYNAKTCLYKHFVNYITERRNLEVQVLPALYATLTPRKLQFSATLHTTKSEDKLLNKIVKTFGTSPTSEITIAWGDWSQTQQLRNFVSTPGIGLRMRLARKGRARRVRIGLVREAYSSCTCGDCRARTKYWKTRSFIKNGTTRTVNIHGLLRCQNESCSKLWNRDVLGSQNIGEIARAVLSGDPRPIHFTIAHPPHAGQ